MGFMGWDKDSLIGQKRKGKNNIYIYIYIYVCMYIYTHTKQVMHNASAHHLLTDAQPVPEQCPPSPPGHPPGSVADT